MEVAMTAKRRYADPTAKRRNVYMSDEVAQKLKALGKGNLSAGIREAVRQTQERHP